MQIFGHGCSSGIRFTGWNDTRANPNHTKNITWAATERGHEKVQCRWRPLRTGAGHCLIRFTWAFHTAAQHGGASHAGFQRLFLRGVFYESGGFCAELVRDLGWVHSLVTLFAFQLSARLLIRSAHGSSVMQVRTADRLPVGPSVIRAAHLNRHWLISEPC